MFVNKIKALGIHTLTEKHMVLISVRAHAGFGSKYDYAAAQAQKTLHKFPLPGKQYL